MVAFFSLFNNYDYALLFNIKSKEIKNMENINTIKISLLGTFSAIGALITGIFGGWDSAMATLLIFMATDYLTGLVVAGVFHKSNKSENGALESKAGFKGLCRKGMILLIVLVAARLDIMLQTNFLKDMVIIAFCTNELISIVENAGLMGLPIPTVITKAIDMLQAKGDEVNATNK